MTDGETSAKRRRRFRQVGLTDADYRTLGEFRRAIRKFLAFSEEGAQDYGLTTQQHQALLAIRSHDRAAITIGELADCLLIKSHSAVGLVSRLEERDLVVRRESPEDRRVALVQLRPRGAEILEAISIRNMGEIERASEILEDMLQVARQIDGRRVADEES